MVRVIFVCLGNICRSPMAEAVFMQRVRQAGLEAHIEADSAGTGHWHLGEPPHRGTLRALRSHGIDCDHRARLVTEADLAEADYVIAMDGANLVDLEALGPSCARLARLLDFAASTALRDVPDPYYSGGFDAVYALVDAATDGLLAHIRREHGL